MYLPSGLRRFIMLAVTVTRLLRHQQCIGSIEFMVFSMTGFGEVGSPSHRIPGSVLYQYNT